MKTRIENERVFPFRMGAWLPPRYGGYLQWLKHLLERLGRDAALATWEEAEKDGDGGLARQVLGSGWKGMPPKEAIDVEGSLAGLIAEIFPHAIEGVGKEDARELVERMAPLPQIRQSLPSLYVWKGLTAYEALHLRFDGLARLTETLVRRYGKQGELIAYDMLHEERVRATGGNKGSVAEFMKDFLSEPEEENLFSVGLRWKVVRAGEQEAVLEVTECAWARYFRERHPQVGYLMACSTDEAAYRAFNESLRLQRTTTLMEGGRICDFRVYAAEEGD